MTTTIPVKRKFGDINTVTLFVGPSRTAFHVHEDNLCNTSPVFKAAFASRFREGTERTMELPDEDADIFDVFVSCLYCKTFSHEIFEIPAPDTYQGQLKQTARLFAIAVKYDVEALQVNICEDLFDLAAGCKNAVPSFAVLKFVYANTRRNAIIRKIIADWFAWTDIQRWQASEGKTKEASTGWLYDIPEFGVDLALALYDPSCETASPIPFKEDNKSRYIDKLQKARKQ